MKIEKNEDHYLLSNDHGSYHFSIEEYEALGESSAKEKAASEIKKKSKVEYLNETINFENARKLGFCEYGIKDFCTKLELDIDKEYSIKDLKDKLTLEVLKNYAEECIKLFGKDIINDFGGVEDLLENLNGDSALFYFIIDNFIEDNILHEFSVKAAYYSLNNYEKEFPNDNRPRLAIEAKEKFIKGEISQEELSATEAAARSAAWSAEAAEAAWSAEAAARSTAWSAEAAAESAAQSAAWSAWSARSARSAEAAESAAYNFFAEELLKLLIY